MDEVCLDDNKHTLQLFLVNLHPEPTSELLFLIQQLFQFLFLFLEAHDQTDNDRNHFPFFKFPVLNGAVLCCVPLT
jgi:hypothetical protein